MTLEQTLQRKKNQVFFHQHLYGLSFTSGRIRIRAIDLDSDPSYHLGSG